jgi:hypothetical protein
MTATERYTVTRNICMCFLSGSKPFTFEEVKKAIAAKEGYMRISSRQSVWEFFDRYVQSGYLKECNETYARSLAV